MEQQFVTSKSKLTIKNGYIQETQLIPQAANYWFMHFLTLLILLFFSIYSAFTDKNEHVLRLVYVPLLLMWIWPHAQRIYRILFIESWSKTIPLKNITEVQMKDLNELEDMVIVLLKSGRIKTYTFRKTEHQAQAFSTCIHEHNAMHAMA